MASRRPRLGRSRGSGRTSPERLVAIDLETTGIDPAVDHIIEIGVVPIVGRRILLGEAWSSLVRPDGYRSDGTVAHHIMPVDLHAAAEPAVGLDRLAERIGSDPILVHHAALDLAFLDRLHQRLGRAWAPPTVIDTVDLLERRNRRLRKLGQPELPLQLGQARLALGLPPAPQHRAVDDAAATAELWLALTAAA